MTAFNSQTWLILGEEIIKYYVMFLSRYCQCCVPDVFFMFVLCVWIAFTYIVSQTSTQMIITWGWIGWTGMAHQTYYLVPNMFCKTTIDLHAVWTVAFLS